ncbi:hypothetical protein HID58_034567 [Brassica napus]|uniref:BnaA09g26690D protein n=2 Tax=Brassica napus TaxID=3708 RepID=A0A078JV95_BRANA|nr:hypothetical protein HID58_034567 [Brassica napus]CAF2044827.1 unnamed protein product [Brassica napus]CAF2116740.1 unnamed protein product [Brassica napus]CDY26318.1 BnaA09g26690D [Brassica napus]CDY71493.1 BnaCnng73160D [Brassica napus]
MTLRNRRRHVSPSFQGTKLLIDSVTLSNTFCDQEAEEGACRSKASTKNPNKPKSPASQCLLHFHVIIAYILFNLVVYYGLNFSLPKVHLATANFVTIYMGRIMCFLL